MIPLIILLVWAYSTWTIYRDEGHRSMGVVYYLALGLLKTMAIGVITVLFIALSMLSLAQFGIIGTTM